MLVTRKEFQSVVEKLKNPEVYAVDTETTGLRWYDNDHLFSIIIADETSEFYFNFLNAADHTGYLPPDEEILLDEHKQELITVFANPDSRWFAHNAKFDIGMLAKEGLAPAGRVHCTEAVARLCDSSHYKYNLAICMERMAIALKKKVPQKSDIVLNYIMEHKLYNTVHIPGKQKSDKNLHYNLVPLKLLVPYGCLDARATYDLGRYQLKELYKLREKAPIENVYELEKKITKICYEMQAEGLPLSLEYVKEGFDKLRPVLKRLEDEYRAYTGIDFVDSGANHKPYFESQGLEIILSEDGNPSMDKRVLESYSPDPVASIILDHRKAAKLSNTYFSTYLHSVGKDGNIHPDFRQSGTRTGRFSMWEPNLQNVPKPDEDFPEDTEESSTVRRCFVPPKGEVLFMADFDQMEYRLMLDLAGQDDLADLIIGGLDVHEATAQMMNVSRKTAKKINFMFLYGGGVAKLAVTLGIAFEEAKRLKELYFEKLPLVQEWIQTTISRARIKKFTRTWYGRVLAIEKDYAYKAPNYVIQGGCADICKIAMVNINELLTKSKAKTKMRLQVHDELIFTMPKEEFDLAPQIVELMAKSYPYRKLPLTAGASHSYKSWGDPVEGYPS